MKEDSRRKCSVCKTIYELNSENFHRSKARWFKGFTYRCKSCSKIRDRGRHRKGKRYAERREYYIKYQANYKKLYPHKVSAQLEARKALKEGRLFRENCSVCNSEKSQAHHPDYNYPLQVVWLCSTHHQEEHQKIKIKAPPKYLLWK